MVKLKDCFKRCKTLKIGGFDCMINNLKGAGRRGFFGFTITLSLVFFCTSTTTTAIGDRRDHGNVKKGTRRQSLYKTCTDTTEIARPVLYIFYYGVIRSAMCQSYGIGYAYRLPYGCLCTVLYSIYKFEALKFEAILVDKH